VTVEVVNQWDDTNTKQKERFDDDNDGVRGKTEKPANFGTARVQVWKGCAKHKITTQPSEKRRKRDSRTCVALFPRVNCFYYCTAVFLSVLLGL